MKLKTLKEMKIAPVYEKWLRQEAIKWIKDSLEAYDGKIVFISKDGQKVKFKHNTPPHEYTEKTEYDHFLQGRMTALINFFNISDEDISK